MPEGTRAAFISYSRRDSEFALRLARDLRAAGARVWLDQLDIGAGSEWDDAIEAALMEAHQVLLILSPASASSRNVRNEVAMALDERKTIIPLMHEDCTVPLQLRRIQHVEFRQGYERGFEALIRAMAAAPADGEAAAAEVVKWPGEGSKQLLVRDEAGALPARTLAGRWTLRSTHALSAVSILMLLLVLGVVVSRFLHPSVPASLKDLALLIPVVIAFGRSKQPAPVKGAAFRLTPSFESGLYGGLIGGTLSGFLIGVPYYLQNRRWVPRVKPPVVDHVGWTIIPESVLYAALIGLAVGAATQFFISWFRHLVRENRFSALLFNDLSGGIAGGILAGVSVGAEGGWVFGARSIPPVSDAVLVCGSAAGPVFIVLGTLIYDYQGRWRAVARAILCSSVVAYLATAFGIFVLQHYGIGGMWFNGADSARAIKEGTVLGVAIGVMLGMQVGLALLFYRLFEVHDRGAGGAGLVSA